MGISYRDHFTNEERKNSIRLLGPITTVRSGDKMQIEMVWAHNKINRTCKNDHTGHGTRGGGGGGRRKGTQKIRWEDNISEWTGLRLGGAL